MYATAATAPHRSTHLLLGQAALLLQRLHRNLGRGLELLGLQPLGGHLPLLRRHGLGCTAQPEGGKQPH